jgi:arginase
MDDARGIEPKDSVTQFLLPSPLTVAIIGAGYVGGQPILGVDKGPDAIRSAGLAAELDGLGWKVNDCGDLRFETIPPEQDPPASNGVKFPRQVGSCCRKIFDEVYSQASQGHLALTLGGDHSLAIGTIAAVCRAWKDTVVVWVDAHGDINTHETTPTGNIHGMPVGFLMGLIDGSVPAFEWLHPCLTPNRIVYIGLRDVDPGEKKVLRQHKIKCFSMTEVDRYGIGKVMEMALDHVNPARDKPIHLSFDVDALDPLAVPSTGTRVKGGLTYREACFVCEAVAETGMLVGLDMVEVNPAIGTPEQVHETAEVAVGLIKSALGQQLV